MNLFHSKDQAANNPQCKNLFNLLRNTNKCIEIQFKLFDQYSIFIE